MYLMTARKTLTLSIVIPVYNEESYLANCLNSIAAQEEKPDEVIVVDNNSTDRTAEIAASYYFVRVVNEPRQGVLHARNTGFNLSKSDIIGRIDADTVLPISWVKDVKKAFLEQPHMAFTGSGMFYDMPFRRALGVAHKYYYFYLNRFITGQYLLWGSNMAIPKMFWHKAKKEISTDESLAEDMDLSIVLGKMCPIVFMPEIMNYNSFRGGKNSMIASWRYLRRWPDSLRRHSKRSLFFAWLIIVSIAFAFGPAALVVYCFVSLKNSIMDLRSDLKVDPETY